MHVLPQEIEVWYIIPAIRREFAKCLIDNHKISYQKVGDLLGISKAAISQYIKGKRAAKVKLPAKAQKKICQSCDLLAAGKTDSVNEITNLLNFIKEEGLACEICDKKIRTDIEDCKEIKLKDLKIRFLKNR
tara:strand:+ start:517 stop:912 length:396 start_codon:yes stop_codon:yes gene_type:complete